MVGGCSTSETEVCQKIKPDRPHTCHLVWGLSFLVVVVLGIFITTEEIRKFVTVSHDNWN